MGMGKAQGRGVNLYKKRWDPWILRMNYRVLRNNMNKTFFIGLQFLISNWSTYAISKRDLCKMVGFCLPRSSKAMSVFRRCRCSTCSVSIVLGGIGRFDREMWRLLRGGSLWYQCWTGGETLEWAGWYKTLEKPWFSNRQIRKRIICQRNRMLRKEWQENLLCGSGGNIFQKCKVGLNRSNNIAFAMSLS